jgi:hypothetical protein
MTIKVTIKHDQPDYPQDIIVRQYRSDDSTTEWMGEGQRLKHGESATVHVYGNVGFSVREAEQVE